jgi:hypothetical protein
MLNRIANRRHKRRDVNVDEGHYLTVVFSYLRIVYVL